MAPTPSPPLPSGLVARAAAQGDADAVATLLNRCEEAVGEPPTIDADEVRADWSRPGLDLARETLLVLDGPSLVASAEVFPGERADVHVDPAARGRGLGAALAAWTEAVARARGEVRIGQTTPDADGAATTLLEGRGYRRRWTSWVLDVPLGPDDAGRVPELPPGHAIRDATPADHPAAHRVIDDAFSEWPGRAPEPYATWRALSVDRPGFAPWQLPLVVRRDEVVGAALLFTPTVGPEGWVQSLAVRPDARGQGLARALLVAAFARFAAGGLARAALSTDSRTGALGLYEHVGMRVRASYTRRSIEL